MDWELVTGRNREALKRIVALLFALAGLADRASRAPWPVRVLVLAILRHGETAARWLLVETSHPGAQPPAAAPAGGSPADAVQLALSLRLLALALSNLLTPTCDTHPVCATSLGPAARPSSPTDRFRHIPGTRHAPSAIRGPPPHAYALPLPNRNVP